MQDYKPAMVVKQNSLVQATYQLDLITQKLILLAIVEARETGEGLSSDSLIYIHASKYAELFNVSLKDAYSLLKKAASDLFEKELTISGDGINTPKDATFRIRWADKIGYSDSEGMLYIRFSQEIVGYITKLTEQYTAYRLEDIVSLDSKYALRLYELLVQWRNAEKIPVFEIQKLREQLGTQIGSYPDMRDFKSNVLDLAIRKINTDTDIKATYTAEKVGRKIIGFSFDIINKSDICNVPDSKVTIIPNTKEATPAHLDRINATHIEITPASLVPKKNSVAAINNDYKNDGFIPENDEFLQEFAISELSIINCKKADSIKNEEAIEYIQYPSIKNTKNIKKSDEKNSNGMLISDSIGNININVKTHNINWFTPDFITIKKLLKLRGVGNSKRLSEILCDSIINEYRYQSMESNKKTNLSDLLDLIEYKLSQMKSSKKNDNSEAFDATSMELPFYVNKDLWLDFCEHRKVSGKKLTTLAVKRIFTNFEAWQAQGLDVNVALNKSIVSNWSGVFPPKKDEHWNNSISEINYADNNQSNSIRTFDEHGNIVANQQPKQPTRSSASDYGSYIMGELEHYFATRK